MIIARQGINLRTAAPYDGQYLDVQLVDTTEQTSTTSQGFGYAVLSAWKKGHSESTGMMATSILLENKIYYAFSSLPNDSHDKTPNVFLRLPDSGEEGNCQLYPDNSYPYDLAAYELFSVQNVDPISGMTGQCVTLKSTFFHKYVTWNYFNQGSLKLSDTAYGDAPADQKHTYLFQIPYLD